MWRAREVVPVKLLRRVATVVLDRVRRFDAIAQCDHFDRWSQAQPPRQVKERWAYTIAEAISRRERITRTGSPWTTPTRGTSKSSYSVTSHHLDHVQQLNRNNCKHDVDVLALMVVNLHGSVLLCCVLQQIIHWLSARLDLVDTPITVAHEAVKHGTLTITRCR